MAKMVCNCNNYGLRYFKKLLNIVIGPGFINQLITFGGPTLKNNLITSLHNIPYFFPRLQPEWVEVPFSKNLRVDGRMCRDGANHLMGDEDVI